MRQDGPGGWTMSTWPRDQEKIALRTLTGQSKHSKTQLASNMAPIARML